MMQTESDSAFRLCNRKKIPIKLLKASHSSIENAAFMRELLRNAYNMALEVYIGYMGNAVFG